MEDDQYPEDMPILVRQTHEGDDLNWIWTYRHRYSLYRLVIKYFYSDNFNVMYATRLTVKNMNSVNKIRRIIKRYRDILVYNRRRKIEDIFKQSDMSEVRFIISNYIL